VESEFEFEVENSGLIATALAERPQVRDGGGGESEPLGSDGAIIVRIDSLVDLHSFDMLVTIGDADPVTVSAATDRVLIDPWRFVPGPLDVHVQAILERDGAEGLAAASTITVDVPSFEPELVLRRSGSGSSRVLLVSARVQALAGPVIRVLIDREEVADSTSQMAAVRSAEGTQEQTVAAFEALNERIAAGDSEQPSAGSAGEAEADPPDPPAPGDAVLVFVPTPAEGEMEVRLEGADGETIATQLLAVTKDRLVPVSGDEASASGGSGPLLASLALVALAALAGGVVFVARCSV
jgi:hypothetical protein